MWFSAIKLVAAAAIVALFGGFLLAGGLDTGPEEAPLPATETSSPSPTADGLLVGAAVEEISPGVVRLLDDAAGHGYREWEGDELRELEDIHVGSDGSVWMVTSDPWQAWQVGVPGQHETSNGGFPGGTWWGKPLLASTPDGTLWVAGEHLASFDGQSWTRHDPQGPSGDPNYDYKFTRAITVLPDGTLWAAWWFDIGRLDPDGWDIYASYDPPTDDGDPDRPCNFADVTRRIAALSDGSVIAGGPGCLASFDGDTWREFESPSIAASPMSDEIRVGGDGTLWAHIDTAPYDAPSDDYLARIRG